ncbi:hypothetical protein [Synechococcus sp. PCC 6312]|uniref:hypothetical protein n=1 Tax=Synechococcus sp. (strain ATCC 27167 / PCC 6312) TaxID=195253 RepID=UPI0002DD9D52|nr:hypothetical protein [Synechococcus sp. PCC 6312]
MVNVIRFIQHFRPGCGNYTKDRYERRDKPSMNDFLTEMRNHKEADDQNNMNIDEIIQ